MACWWLPGPLRSGHSASPWTRYGPSQAQKREDAPVIPESDNGQLIERHRWRDVWLPPEIELITGCILLVLSAGFWMSADAGPIGSLKHWPWTVGAVLGPWFVYRAWKRKP